MSDKSILPKGSREFIRDDLISFIQGNNQEGRDILIRCSPFVEIEILKMVIISTIPIPKPIPMIMEMMLMMLMMTMMTMMMIMMMMTMMIIGRQMVKKSMSVRKRNLKSSGKPSETKLNIKNKNKNEKTKIIVPIRI